MNKVYLIIAKGNFIEDGYYILPGSTSLVKTEKIVNNINKLLDYISSHPSSHSYSSKKDIIKDIEHFESLNPEIKINKSEDMICMINDYSGLGIDWLFTIKEVVIQ